MQRRKHHTHAASQPNASRHVPGSVWDSTRGDGSCCERGWCQPGGLIKGLINASHNHSHSRRVRLAVYDGSYHGYEALAPIRTEAAFVSRQCWNHQTTCMLHIATRSHRRFYKTLLEAISTFAHCPVAFTLITLHALNQWPFPANRLSSIVLMFTKFTHEDQ